MSSPTSPPDPAGGSRALVPAVFLLPMGRTLVTPSALDTSNIIDVFCGMAPHALKKLSASRLFHALSDETRLQILEQLRDGEQCVCDLTSAFQTGQSRLSFHLKVLKEAGLVNDRPDGRWVYYSLNGEAGEHLQVVADWFKASSYRAAKRGCCP